MEYWMRTAALRWARTRAAGGFSSSAFLSLPHPLAVAAHYSLPSLLTGPTGTNETVLCQSGLDTVVRTGYHLFKRYAS